MKQKVIALNESIKEIFYYIKQLITQSKEECKPIGFKINQKN